VKSRILGAKIMVAIRSELQQNYRVFFVTAQGYAADHWFGWLPKVLNMHPEIFALLAHEGSRPKYFKERTRGERPDLLMFAEFLNDMGMTYNAIGDCYSYRAHQMPLLIAKYRRQIPVLNFTRHPYAWLEFYVRWRASNMRMPDGSTAPLDWEWNSAKHDLFQSLGLPAYEKNDVEIWASYQGMYMLNEHLEDFRSGIPTMPIETITKDPKQFQAIVSYLTKNNCTYSPQMLDQVYSIVNTPFRGEEKINATPSVLYEQWPDWKRAAFHRIVPPAVIKAFESFGYKFIE
jgi:hypothetical protein